MPPKIRVEILIPTFYNETDEGIREPIESRKHRAVKNQIVSKFGGISTYPLTIAGIWVDKDGKKHYDNCIKYEVCIDPHNDYDKDLEEYKKELENFFRQFEIHITHHELVKV